MVLFQVPNLTTLIPNTIVEGLDLTVSLVSLVLQFTLFANRFIESHLQDTELFLVLFGGGFRLLKLLSQFLNQGGILGPRLLFGGVVGDPWNV